jgi:hypothetical protein
LKPIILSIAAACFVGLGATSAGGYGLDAGSTATTATTAGSTAGQTTATTSGTGGTTAGGTAGGSTSTTAGAAPASTASTGGAPATPPASPAPAAPSGSNSAGVNSGGFIPPSTHDFAISHWPVAFLGGDAPGYVKKDGSIVSPTTGDRRESTLTALAATLNALYQDVKVTSGGDSLIIMGPRERVRRVKTILAKWLDVPYPQVQLNVMSFQAASRNYNADRVNDAVTMATAGIKLSREFMKAYYIDFTNFVREGGGSFFYREDVRRNEDLHRALFARFHLLGDAGFLSPTGETLEVGRTRVKPFVDNLAYLLLSDPSLYDEGGVFQNFFKSEKANTRRLLKLWDTQFTTQEAVLTSALETMKGGGKELCTVNGEHPELVGMSRAAIERQLAFAVALHRLTQSFTHCHTQAFNHLRMALRSTPLEQDLAAVENFMFEYSLPNTYDELRPGANLRLYQSDLVRQETWLDEQIGDVEHQIDVDRQLLDDVIESIRILRARINGEDVVDSEAIIAQAKARLQRECVYLDIQKKRLEDDEVKLKKERDGKPKPSATRIAQLNADLSRDDSQLKAIALRQAFLNSLSNSATAGISTPKSALGEWKTRLGDAITDKGALVSEISSLGSSLESLKGKLRNVTETEQGVGFAKDNVQLDAIGEPMRPVDPDALSILGSNVDELIKTATDAFSEDIDVAVTEPLRLWIEENNRGHKDGLVYTGNVSLAVTSTRGAASGGSATLYTPFTPQQHLNQAQLGALFDVGHGFSLFSSQGAESILSAIAALSEVNNATGPATGAPMYVPIYTSVAPGLDLSVRPSVLPGARAARLVVSFRASNSVTDSDSNRHRPDPLSAINSHETTTDVAVDAFDIFPLSTFSVETTALGDPQWRIYGLEGIPIIGNVFVGPRRPVTNTARSLVVVYTTILPRSLDIARRYSADSD